VPSILTGANHATLAELGYSIFGRGEYAAGYFFVKKNPDYRFLLFAGRLCCICLLLACFVAAYRYATLFGGKVAGYFMIGLCLFSPYVLGHGHLVAPDAASGMFALVSVGCFWRWLRQPNRENAFIAGIMLGLAELTKFTLLIFYPLLVILWIIYRFPNIGTKSPVPLRRQFLHLLLIYAVSLLVINTGYMFEGTGKRLRTYKFETTLFTGCETLEDVPFYGGNRFDGSGNFIETALGYLPMPLPKNFIQGIDTQRCDFESGKGSYLRGKWAERGWWYYYLYALLIKTPLGTIGILFLAIYCTVCLKGYNADWRDEMVVLLPGIAILAFVSSQTGFSIHSRYVIPALPFFFLWSCKVARAFTPALRECAPKSSRTVRRIAVTLLAWSVASSLWVYPHSIAYFNELAAVIPTSEDRNYPKPEQKPTLTVWQKVHRLLDAGPLNGPRHLLDSNIDWGQDHYRLERWCARHPELQGVNADDWYGYPLELTSIPRKSSNGAEPDQPRWYAISVNRVYGENGHYRSLLNFTPEVVIGYTTYLYHVPPEQLARVMNLDAPKEATP
jgi:hypothetical protein